MQSGALKWNFTLTEANSVVVAPPVVSQSGLVILNVQNYQVLAFDQAGALAWNVTVNKGGGSLLNLPLALQGDMLFMASGNALYGLHANDGSHVFRSANVLAFFNSGPMVDAKGICYLTNMAHQDFTLDPMQYYISLYAYECSGGTMGSLKWTYNAIAPFPATSAHFGTPALSSDGNLLYVGSTSLLAIDTLSGTLQWMFNYSDPSAGHDTCGSSPM